MYGAIQYKELENNVTMVLSLDSTCLEQLKGIEIYIYIFIWAEFIYEPESEILALITIFIEFMVDTFLESHNRLLNMITLLILKRKWH